MPFGLIATLEGIYSKGYNNIVFENLNREIDPNFTFSAADQRPRYYSGRRSSAFDEIILFSNSNEGYTYNFVAQLQKQMERVLRVRFLTPMAVRRIFSRLLPVLLILTGVTYIAVNRPNHRKLALLILIPDTGFRLCYLPERIPE